MAGGVANGAVTGAIAAGEAIKTGALLGSIGPLGAIILGAMYCQNTPAPLITYDCWKAVHDESSEPSNGRLLVDILRNPGIQDITFTENSKSKNLSNIIDGCGGGTLPQLMVRNVWGERFRSITCSYRWRSVMRPGRLSPIQRPGCRIDRAGQTITLFLKILTLNRSGHYGLLC